jgi:hypothetical protein
MKFWKNLSVEYRWLIAIGAFVLAFIIICALLAAFFNGTDGFFTNKTMRQHQANVNAQGEAIKAQEGAIHELEKEDAAQSAILEENRKDHEAAKSDTNTKNEAADEARRNADAVRNANYANSNLERANRARCKAYPSSPGC